MTFASLTLLGFGPHGWGWLLLTAVMTTLAVTLAAVAIGAVVGAVIAGAKLSGHPGRVAAGTLYTTVFRGTPELLVIYLVYFGLPSFLRLPPFAAGALAVGAISGAYQAEVFRGAFLAVQRNELEAARAFGMAPLLRLRRIIAPQVLRFALPGLGNVWQLSLKDSALVSVTGLAELLRQSQVGAGSTHQYFLFYVAGGALYLLLTSISGQAFDAAERQTRRSLPRRA